MKIQTDNWKSFRLKDIAVISTGSTPPTKNRENFGDEYGFATPGDICGTRFIKKTAIKLSNKGIIKTRLAREGSVLFVCIGSTIGKVAQIAEAMAYNQQINACTAKEGVDQSFFYYALLNCSSMVRRMAGTQAVPIVNKSTFQHIQINLPPIAEQRKIAEILSAQDRVIELKTKLLEEKKRLKKYLCQVLISGESQSEGKKILFKELFEFLNNNSCSRAQMKEKGTIYNVHYGDILTKYGEILDAKKDEVPCICDNINLSKYDRLQNGDIVFADTAEDLLVGKSTELKNVGNKHIIAGLHTIAARPIKDCFIPGWLGYYTNSPSYRRQLYTCAQGSKVISILRKDIIDTIVDVPDKTIQKKVVTVLDIISDEIKKIRIVIEQEKLKKKALMQQLLTGKVRVSV